MTAIQALETTVAETDESGRFRIEGRREMPRGISGLHPAGDDWRFGEILIR